jgi:hypothetical protein
MLASADIFTFPEQFRDGIGTLYEIVVRKDGTPIGLLRDKVTKKFVAQATKVGLNPLSTIIPLNNLQSGMQALQVSVGVLQATTAVIGVGVAANLAISAVTLHQTLKLREDVKQARLEIRNGFIDLRSRLQGMGDEIIERLEDVRFEPHRVVLIQAYGRFLEAIRLMKAAMNCNDPAICKADIANARQILVEALADYRNPHLLKEVCAAGQLRRMECAWAIEQMIVLSYELQQEYKAVGELLTTLQERIRRDSLNVLNECDLDVELGFLFPEIKRIHDHDLVSLALWQARAEWTNALPPSELELLQLPSADDSPAITQPASQLFGVEVLPEELYYAELCDKSHPQAMRDQLRFMLSPDLRQQAEQFVDQYGHSQGRRILTKPYLEEMSDGGVANLYWYAKQKSEQKI